MLKSNIWERAKIISFFPKGGIQLRLFFAGHNNKTTGGWGERPLLLGSNDTERIYCYQTVESFFILCCSVVDFQHHRSSWLLSLSFKKLNCDFSGVLQSEAEGNGSCLAPQSGCPDLAFHIKFSLWVNFIFNNSLFACQPKFHTDFC